MDVLDHQQHRPVPCRERQQRNDRLEEAQLRLARVGRWLRQPVAGQRRKSAQLPRAGPRASRSRSCPAVEVVADRLDEGR
jgi:hypothetical protein